MDKTYRKLTLALVGVLALSFATVALAACGGSDSEGGDTAAALSHG